MREWAKTNLKRHLEAARYHSLRGDYLSLQTVMYFARTYAEVMPKGEFAETERVMHTVCFNRAFANANFCADNGYLYECRLAMASAESSGFHAEINIPKQVVNQVLERAKDRYVDATIQAAQSTSDYGPEYVFRQSLFYNPHLEDLLERRIKEKKHTDLLGFFYSARFFAYVDRHFLGMKS